MLHPRIKRELLRSIGIFGFAMFVFLFISFNLNDYYWSIFVGPILIVIFYITLIVIWVKKKELLPEKNLILDSHRILVGSMIFLIFLTFALPYLTFLIEFNEFSILIFLFFILFLGLSIISIFLNNKKIKNAIGKNKEELGIQRKLLIQEVLVGGILVYILGISIIVLPPFKFILWIIPLIAIPAGLCIEILEKNLSFKIK